MGILRKIKTTPLEKALVMAEDKHPYREILAFCEEHGITTADFQSAMRNRVRKAAEPMSENEPTGIESA